MRNLLLFGLFLLLVIIVLSTVHFRKDGQMIALRNWIGTKLTRIERARGKSKLNKLKAKKLIDIVLDASEAAGIRMFVSEGTALGAVRQQDFIDDDTDIDFGFLPQDLEVYRNQVIPQIVSSGMVLIKNSDRPTKCLQTYHKEGESVDIHMWAPGMECPDVPGPCDVLLPLLEPFQEVTLAGRKVWAPSNAYLEFLYGKDYLTPKPRFKPSQLDRSTD